MQYICTSGGRDLKIRINENGKIWARWSGFLAILTALFALSGCGPSPEQQKLNQMKSELKTEKAAIEAEIPKLDSMEAKLDGTSAGLKVKKAGLEATVAMYKGRGAPASVVKIYKENTAAFNKEVDTYNIAVKEAKKTFDLHNARVDAYNVKLNEAKALNKQINGPNATLTTTSVIMVPRVRIRRM